jgi:hypothetical protein
MMGRKIYTDILFGIQDKDGVIFHVVAKGYGEAVQKYKRCRADALSNEDCIVDPDSIPEPKKISVVCEGVNLIL